MGSAPEDEIAKQRLQRELEQRNRGLACLSDVVTILQDEMLPLEQVLQGVVDIIPTAWHYPEDACCRLAVEGRTITSGDFQETQWNLREVIAIGDRAAGSLEVCYRRERPALADGPFSKEERALFICLTKLTQRYLADLKLRDDLRASQQRFGEIIDTQSRSLLELSTPVQRLWDGVLMVPLVGILDTQRAQQATERLLQAIVETESQVAILDVLGVPVIDSRVALHLGRTVAAADLLGCRVIVTGMRPEVARMLVQLDVKLSWTATCGTLRAGLAEAFRLLGLTVARRGAPD